jgi:hypothetical protein
LIYFLQVEEAKVREKEKVEEDKTGNYEVELIFGKRRKKVFVLWKNFVDPTWVDEGCVKGLKVYKEWKQLWSGEDVESSEEEEEGSEEEQEEGREEEQEEESEEGQEGTEKEQSEEEESEEEEREFKEKTTKTKQFHWKTIAQITKKQQIN